MKTMQPERNEKKKEKSNYFYCYSPKLRKHLDLNNLRWIKKDIHEITKRPFWVFERTEKLGELIDEFQRMRDAKLSRS